MSSSPSRASDLSIAPTLASRAVGGFGTSLLCGAALGAAAWLSDQLGYPLGLLLPANAIGVWLALAFGLGASARTVPTGALRGLVGLLAAVLVYYVLFAALGQGFRSIGAPHAAIVWGVVALLAGPSMGGAGALWRYGSSRPRALGVAALAAGLAGEGIAFGLGRLVRLDQLGSDPGALLLAVEILVALVLPVILLRPAERARCYALSFGLAVVAAAAIGPVTALIRGLADRF